MRNKKKKGYEMELTGRDIEILRMVYKFRFCLGRHINAIAGFTGLRAADRRLKILIDAGYLKRKKYLYGVAYLYTLTHKGRVLLGVNKHEDKIRIEQIAHDIYVVESVIYFISKYGISIHNIESEKELHVKDGFGTRKHHPDFKMNASGKIYAVEIELNQKTKIKLERNIRDNYLNYDKQIWITNDKKVLAMIESLSDEYSGIEIIHLKEVERYARE